MDELSGKVQNASTHILSSKMHEHTRTASSQVTGASEEMSRKVQNFHWGDGGNVAEGSKSEHTYVASFWYTLVWVSVAVP